MNPGQIKIVCSRRMRTRATNPAAAFSGIRGMECFDMDGNVSLSVTRIAKACGFGSIRILTLLALFVGFLSPVAYGQTQREPIIPMAAGVGSSQGSTSSAGVSGMSDDPISAGEIVHINVFNAPDFSLSTRVSQNGEIAVPFLGGVRIAGLSSTEAGSLLAGQFKAHNLLMDPQVMVTVEATASGITVLGEVHSPGIFPPPGKHNLSDLLALAGGLTANTGRIIEISNSSSPEQKEYIPWDPTMHNTGGYDHPVRSGDRILVRACGIAYIGGNVGKPGAYSLCGSPKVTFSELLSLAGGSHHPDYSEPHDHYS